MYGHPLAELPPTPAGEEDTDSSCCASCTAEKTVDGLDPIDNEVIGEELPTLRFNVGTQVLCNTEEGWLPGHIVKLWYCPKGSSEGGCKEVGCNFPYQVALEDGDIIYVPYDMDTLCRLRVLTWWEQLFKQVTMFGPDVEEVRAAVCEGSVDIDSRNFNGSTALTESLRLGWVDCVNVLLELGASVNVATDKGQTPLHHAVGMNGDIEDVPIMVRALVEKRADPNVQDRDVNKDPSFSSKSFEEREKHRTPLHYCAAWDFASAATILLEATADPNIIDTHYQTPMHVAIEEQASHEIVELLLASKADPDTSNIKEHCSYLMVAAYKGDAKLASALISAKANLDKAGSHGMTALHMAVRSRHGNVARILIKAGCDTNIKGMGKTAAELASTNRVWDIAKLLGSEQNASPEPKQITTFEDLDDVAKKELFID